jgi:serine/threonine-protein kinase
VPQPESSPAQFMGRYELFEELGRGAMGAVYRGRDPAIDRPVAVKTIRMDRFAPGEEEGYKKRFFREAQAAGKLSHPGIVTVYDVGVDDAVRTPYIVMEYIEGRTLESVLTESAASMTMEARLEILRQVAEALDYAHARGIVHRDIKPANILVTPEGRAKITDFGVARLRQTQMSTHGEFVGTPSYMSPEQVRGQRVDGRADIFSLGIISYRVLTGQPPFTGDLAELVAQVASKEPPPPTRLNPSLEPAFDRVVGRALAKDTQKRYQRGREMAADIEDLLEGREPRSFADRSAPATVEQPVEQTLRLADGTMQLPAPGEVSALGMPGTRTISRRRPPRQRAADYPPNLWGLLLKATDFSFDAMTRMEENFLAWNARVRPMPRLWNWLKARGAQFLAWNARVRPLPRAWAWYRARSARTQVILAAVFVAALALSVWLIGFPPRAVVAVTLNHNMRTGSLSLWVDEHHLGETRLSGEEASRRGALRLYKGTYTASIRMTGGHHVLRVRCASPEFAYEETREVRGTFPLREERALDITCDARNKLLRLDLR